MPDPIAIGPLAALIEQPAVESRAPILFVHGYFADATVFQAWMPYFAARGHRCLAVHLRGRQGSRPGTKLGAVTMQEFAEDALAAARFLGRPIVVGHSMGGLIAQMIAAEDAVCAAVLLAPAPPRGITVMSVELAMTQIHYMPAILLSHLVRPRREDLRRMVMNRLPREMQDPLLELLTPDSGRAGRDMSILGVPVDSRRIRVPVFVAGGDDDHFIPLDRVRRVAERYGVPLDVAKGHGHMLVLEPGWEELAARVANWIAQVPWVPQAATSAASG